MYKYLENILEVKCFNGKQLKVKGTTNSGNTIYLYTTTAGEWKQTTAEFWEK